MRRRFLLASVAVSVAFACGGGFGSEAVPIADDDAGADAALDTIAPAEGGDGGGNSSCDPPKISAATTRFQSAHGNIESMKTDGVWLYVKASQGVERARASGTVSTESMGVTIHVDEIGVTSSSVFYRLNDSIYYRPHETFTTDCGTCVRFGPGYPLLLGEGLGDRLVSAAAGNTFAIGGPPTVQDLLQKSFDPTTAAVSPGFVVVAGKSSGESAISILTSPDAGSFSFVPVQMATDGKTIYFTEQDGSVIAIDVASHVQKTLAPSVGAPRKSAFLTGKHFWFGTDNGLQRVRLADGCVQQVTPSVPSSFVVVGTSLFTIDQSNVLETVVSD